MPCYQISRAHLHEEVEKLERKGERVTSVVADGAAFVVITEVIINRQVGGMETRG